MSDTSALIFNIRLRLEALQTWLPRAVSRANNPSDPRFSESLQNAAQATDALVEAFDALSKMTQNPYVRVASAQARALSGCLRESRTQPAILKLPSTYEHYKEILTSMLQIDSTWRPLGDSAPKKQTLSAEERKARFLSLWQSQQGLARMRSILEQFISLKRLVTANTKLSFINALDQRSQAKTRHGQTQAEVGNAFTSQLDELYATIFRPCLEEDIAVFWGGKLSLGHNRLTRSCADRTVLFDGQPTQDPIVLMASDLRCINGEDSIESGRSFDFEHKINSSISADYLILAFDKIRVVVMELSRIIPSDTPPLRELLIRWVDEENKDFHEIGQRFISRYPTIYHSASRESFLRGL